MTVKEKSASIVLTGSFNPAIFQPAWISEYGLLADEEMDGFYNEQTVKKIPEFGIEIGTGQPFQVNNDQAVAVFKSFSLQVLRDRFAANISTNESVAIKFVRKVFSILSETPIKACGMNFNAHVQCKSNYSKIINELFDQKSRFIKIFGHNVGMGVKLRTHFEDTILTITIERSVKFEDALYIDTNFHRQIEGGAKKLNTLDLTAAFESSKDHFMNNLVKDLSNI